MSDELSWRMIKKAQNSDVLSISLRLMLMRVSR